MVFTPDGQTLISASGDRTIRLWDVTTGKEKSRFPGHQAKIYSLALSPDGRTLASGGSDQIVRLWEIVSSQEIQQFQGHQGEVRSVSFSPDGRKVASGSEDQTVLVWDVTGSARPARPEDLEKLWTDLGGDDASKAHRAIWTMIAMPKESIAFLKKQLKPMLPLDPKLVADLNSNSFAKRQKATEELERLGEDAEPTLEESLGGQAALGSEATGREDTGEDQEARVLARVVAIRAVIAGDRTDQRPRSPETLEVAGFRHSGISLDAAGEGVIGAGEQAAGAETVKGRVPWCCRFPESGRLQKGLPHRI